MANGRPTRSQRERLEFHYGVELARLSECSGVVFLDGKAAPAGCDGAPYSVIFLDAKAFPVRALNTYFRRRPMFSAASAIRFANAI